MSLRLQIFYEFKPNRQGKIVRHHEILDFAAQQDRSYSKPPVQSIPGNITIYGTRKKYRWFTYLGNFLHTSVGDFNMNQNIILKASYKITINGNLQGFSKNLNLIAGNSVIVNNNVTIGNNVTLETDNSINGNIYPVSPAYVKSFCASSQRYKAKHSYHRLTRASGEDKDEIDNLPVKLIDIESILEDDLIPFSLLVRPRYYRRYFRYR